MINTLITSGHWIRASGLMDYIPRQQMQLCNLISKQPRQWALIPFASMLKWSRPVGIITAINWACWYGRIWFLPAMTVKKEEYNLKKKIKRSFRNYIIIPALLCGYYLTKDGELMIRRD